MKKHNGMRPQDIVILLKIIALKKEDWKNSDLSYTLKISPSEISEALNRNAIAGLIDKSKRKVFINSLTEFLIYGLKYVFPVQPAEIVRGIPTAHSASPMNELISSSKDIYVWQHEKGTAKGQKIEPLYKTVPQVVSEDKLFYELLSIIDTIRVGKAREVKIAIDELKIRLTNV
ncbi:MAG: hypothetical protein JXR68_12485 [Bacteroidales bacterium]|nr:hypothetical protein [Bacteroidales bacterium]